jgi:hypothetical protein
MVRWDGQAGGGTLTLRERVDAGRTEEEDGDRGGGKLEKEPRRGICRRRLCPLEDTNVRAGRRERTCGREGRRRRCWLGGGEEDVRAVEASAGAGGGGGRCCRDETRREEKGIAKSATEKSRVAGDEATRGPRCNAPVGSVETEAQLGPVRLISCPGGLEHIGELLLPASSGELLSNALSDGSVRGRIRTCV